MYKESTDLSYSSLQNLKRPSFPLQRAWGGQGLAWSAASKNCLPRLDIQGRRHWELTGPSGSQSQRAEGVSSRRHSPSLHTSSPLLQPPHRPWMPCSESQAAANYKSTQLCFAAPWLIALVSEIISLNDHVNFWGKGSGQKRFSIISATISWVSSMTGQSREKGERINFFKGHQWVGGEQPGMRDEGHRRSGSLNMTPVPGLPTEGHLSASHP